LVKYRTEKETINLPDSGRIFPGSAILAYKIRKIMEYMDYMGRSFTANVIKTSYYNNVFINIILSIIFINALLLIKS
jgi:hypothetical protein